MCRERRNGRGSRLVNRQTLRFVRRASAVKPLVVGRNQRRQRFEQGLSRLANTAMCDKGQEEWT